MLGALLCYQINLFPNAMYESNYDYVDYTDSYSYDSNEDVESFSYDSQESFSYDSQVANDYSYSYVCQEENGYSDATALVDYSDNVFTPYYFDYNSYEANSYATALEDYSDKVETNNFVKSVKFWNLQTPESNANKLIRTVRTWNLGKPEENKLIPHFKSFSLEDPEENTGKLIKSVKTWNLGKPEANGNKLIKTVRTWKLGKPEENVHKSTEPLLHPLFNSISLEEPKGMKMSFAKRDLSKTPMEESNGKPKFNKVIRSFEF